MRNFGRCIHCMEPLDSPDFRTCGTCAVLAKDDVETEDERRDRLHNERVAHVNGAFIRGRRALLARSLDPSRVEWAIPQPR